MRSDHDERFVQTRRRSFLKTIGAGTLVGLAGCSGDRGSGDGGSEDGGSEDGGSQGGSDGSQSSKSLRLITSTSENSVEHTEGGAVFAKRSDERTGGSLTWDTFIAGELGAADETLNLIQNQVAAAGFCVQGWHADKIPLSGIVSIPGGWEKWATAAEALWRISSPVEDGILYDVEHKPLGVRSLFTTGTTPYQLYSTERIETLDDLQGMSIRSVGGIQSLVIESLGAEPVEVAGGDILPAFQRGTVDAVAMDPSIGAAYDVQSVADYLTTNVNLGGAYTQWLMNEDVYGNLSAAHQTAIDNAGNDVIENAPAVDEYNQTLLEDWEKNDVLTTYEVEDPDQWSAAVSDVSQDWVQRQNNPDDAQKVLDAWNQALEKAKSG